MDDLFSAHNRRTRYSAADIEILEGLEPVRRRPGMYVGGTDQAALHHLASEILDNAVDEALAGHARWIEFRVEDHNRVCVQDNGRGIPIDSHPRFPERSALEVICTMLHTGGKFQGGVYRTAGGLHGVGLSVVNALSETMTVEVFRNGTHWRQDYGQGKPATKLAKQGATRLRGTRVSFQPDSGIFDAEARFRPATLYRMARSKAQLIPDLEIRWRCAEHLLGGTDDTPASDTLHFPGGLADVLEEVTSGRALAVDSPFTGSADLGESGRVEWAVRWLLADEGHVRSWCNTIPTPQGGTHEAGLRAGLVRGVRNYGELVRHKRADGLTADDITGGACGVLSVFVEDPLFQGQTKERLASSDVRRQVENVVRSHLDYWLAEDVALADGLLEHCTERMETRQRRRQEKARRTNTSLRRLRLPGKLADCTQASADGTEIFLVEGDSAGGSAKQARDRDTQAVLAMRGKILNVASASEDKLRANQELSDLTRALGCHSGSGFDLDQLRYERVIIMTDADVDGAHIASLLLTFFFRQMRPLVESGHLYIAQPPLYRLAQRGLTRYARDDADRDHLLATEFDSRGKVEISRFKGLGEMPAVQLRATTMDPERRTLIRVSLPSHSVEDTTVFVNDVMGRKPERRLAFLRVRAPEAAGLDL